MEAVCVAVLSVVFVHVHFVDVRHRVVLAADLIAIGAVRAVLCVLAEAGGFPAGSFGARWWGWEGLVASGAAAMLVVLAVAALRAVVSRMIGGEAIGLGDLGLYGACLLFLDPSGAVGCVALSALVGAVQGVVALVRRTRTFPFAPAIVWSCWAVLVLRIVLS